MTSDRPLADSNNPSQSAFTNVTAETITVRDISQTINQNYLPRSPESARFSLPADPPEFTGRLSEIEQIKADLAQNWVVNIAGMPGVGKSALAVRIAHQLKDQYPGGQIYLNLRGADDHPMTVESALESLLRSLGVDPAQFPTEQAERVALYRSKVAQQPTLVLLDNAATSAQVQDLLPGSSACIITSRRQLDGLTGVKPLNLEALSEPEALALLTTLLPDRVQRESGAAHQIVAYCGRLPLALRIAAGTLAMRSWQSRSMADYAAQLADERQRLNHLKLENLDLRASFELSYRELDPTAADLLGKLGLLPADFGTEILVPLTEQPLDIIQPALDALVDGRLVDPLPDERYVLHDLMRLFAVEKLTDPTKALATKTRLVQWCADGAALWATALNPIRRKRWAEYLIANWEGEEPIPLVKDLQDRLLRTAQIWFEHERKTLVQAFIWAADTQQRAQSIAIAANLVPFFGLCSYWGDWALTHQLALTAARQSGDQQGEGMTLNNLGHVYRELGEWRESVNVYKQALQIFQTIGDSIGERQSLNGLGTLYGSQGRYDEALAAFEQVLQTCRGSNDVHGEGAALNNLGLVYTSQGKWDRASTVYKQSLEICRSFSDEDGERATVDNLGVVYRSQGKLNMAISAHERALHISQSLGNAQGQGKALTSLGSVYRLQGKWNEATAVLEQALRIFRGLDDVPGEGQALNELSTVYGSLELWDKATVNLHRSLEIKRKIGDVRGESTALMNIGNVKKLQGEWDEAITAYEQSLQIKRAIKDIHGEGMILANLGGVYQLQKHPNRAVLLWQEALTKLCPGSPEYQHLAQLLKVINFQRQMRGWLLTVAMLLFIGWNLLRGHWWVALLCGAGLAFWLWKQRRR